jgi:hypothetical protein
VTQTHPDERQFNFFTVSHRGSISESAADTLEGYKHGLCLISKAYKRAGNAHRKLADAVKENQGELYA